MFECCEGKIPITLVQVQEALFVAKGWMTLPKLETTDWQKLDKSLCETYHLTPQQLDDMTFPEIKILCGPPEMNSTKAMYHFRLKDKLTIQEKLYCMEIALSSE